MLRLEKVNGKNVWELLKLRVSDDQRNFADQRGLVRDDYCLCAFL